MWSPPKSLPLGRSHRSPGTRWKRSRCRKLQTAQPTRATPQRPQETHLASFGPFASCAHAVNDANAHSLLSRNRCNCMSRALKEPHAVATQKATPNKSSQRYAAHAGGPRCSYHVHRSFRASPLDTTARNGKARKKRCKDQALRAAITDDLAPSSKPPTPTMSIPFCASTAAAKRPATPGVLPPDAARASERSTRFMFTAACAAWLDALLPGSTRATTCLPNFPIRRRCQGARRWTGAQAFKCPHCKAGRA